MLAPRHLLIGMLGGAVAAGTYLAPVPTRTGTGEATADAAAGWTLQWADEFNGSSLDTGKWTPERDSTYGDGNHELACLTDRPENLRVAGGALHITARRESTPYRCGNDDSRFPHGRTYTSAMVSTQGKASWRYGRLEMRARTASATEESKGLWGAAWMLPADGSNGEIDILEVLGTGPGGGRSKAHQALHGGSHPLEENDYSLPSSAPSMAAAFHTYAIEWGPDEMRWYVDGVKTWTRNTSTTSWFGSTFDRSYYLRLNLAVGGTWPGAPTSDTTFPADYVIDWFRVYSAS